jgi:tRNA(fMet)-specific endonuclease VapC
MYLYDTSVLIAVLRQNPDVERRRQAATGTPYVSAVAHGELLYGARHSQHAMQALADVQALVATMAVLDLNSLTADLYSAIKHDLRLKGQMIPDNDLWIAATALQAGLTLAARDTHFARVAGLPFEHW